MLTLKVISVLNCILFDTNNVNGILNLGPYQYTQYIPVYQFYSYISFENIQLIHLDSNLHSRVRIFIYLRFQSRTDTLFCSQIKIWYRYIGYMKVFYVVFWSVVKNHAIYLCD